MMPVIDSHCYRVIQHKNSGVTYPIPFELVFHYTHPQVDQVPPQMLVDVTVLDLKVGYAIETITEAVDFYTTAFQQQFSGIYGPSRKQAYLHRFVSYLQTTKHSLLLAELTLIEGQKFLDSLVSTRKGTPLSLHLLKCYKSALRTFSRFLYQANLLPQDIFFALIVNTRAEEKFLDNL